MNAPTPLEQPCETMTPRRALTIGLPTCADPAERRFPLTPEGAGRLIDRGFRIKMQEGAAASIHYADAAYTRAGVEIVSRKETLGCDIVIHPASLGAADITAMRRGAMLLTMMRSAAADSASIRQLLNRHILTIALDLVEDTEGNTPFADILAEIDGRASVAIASSLLADARRGKGILLGGVAGVIPCETLIIGSGIAACAASLSAIGLGSTVRVFDNDVYSLRRASLRLGQNVITSSLHPRTLESALKSADVVIVTPTREPFSLHADTVEAMKKGVITFDLTPDADGSAFPSMTPVDLAQASAVEASERIHGRLCFVHAGNAVARTAAMALSNTLLTFMEGIVTCEGLSHALKLHPGMQKATLTFFGKIVNPRIAATMRTRSVDISIYLTLS